MKKHLFGYGFCILSIMGLVYLYVLTQREIIHQRAWLASSQQLTLGITYMELSDMETDIAMHNLKCAIAVHGMEAQAWQANLKNIPNHHQTFDELNKYIEKNFAFIKTLEGLDHTDIEVYYKENCMPECASNCNCKREHVTSSGTGQAKLARC